MYVRFVYNPRGRDKLFRNVAAINRIIRAGKRRRIFFFFYTGTPKRRQTVINGKQTAKSKSRRNCGCFCVVTRNGGRESLYLRSRSRLAKFWLPTSEPKFNHGSFINLRGLRRAGLSDPAVFLRYFFFFFFRRFCFCRQRIACTKAIRFITMIEKFKFDN